MRSPIFLYLGIGGFVIPHLGDVEGGKDAAPSQPGEETSAVHRRTVSSEPVCTHVLSLRGRFDRFHYGLSLVGIVGAVSDVDNLAGEGAAAVVGVQKDRGMQYVIVPHAVPSVHAVTASVRMLN